MAALSLAVLSFLMLIVTMMVACYEANSNMEPQVYWRSTLPSTPIPTSLQYFLNEDVKNPFSLDDKVVYSPALCFSYSYKICINTKKIEPNFADFILEKDLMTTGTKMDLHFYASTVMTGGFLSRSAVKSVPPFSSESLPELLHYFSVQPNSQASKSVRESLTTCESPALANESKYCATSLESMVDFATSTLGTKDFNVLSTTTSPLVDNKKSLKQRYKVVSGAKEFADVKRAVVCHPMVFPYAVFYCHMTSEAKIYSVPLVGEDGNKVKAIAVCHTDTSSWSPEHMSFTALHVKPGTIPVCHFLPQDHIVWVPAQAN